MDEKTNSWDYFIDLFIAFEQNIINPNDDTCPKPWGGDVPLPRAIKPSEQPSQGCEPPIDIPLEDKELPKVKRKYL